jgi:hypothetical protein
MIGKETGWPKPPAILAVSYRKIAKASTFKHSSNDNVDDPA